MSHGDKIPMLVDIDGTERNAGVRSESFVSQPMGNNHLPVTRYYGSKRRIIDWIKSSVVGLEFETVLDVFGGTGTVSLMFKSLDKKVFYNDILLSSSLQAKALLGNNAILNFESKVDAFCNEVIPESGFIAQNFHDVFYNVEENKWLDGAIRLLGEVQDHQHYAELYYCLQQSCVQKRPFNLFHRKNHYLRVNNNQNTKFGNWVTWERSFQELMGRAARDLEKARFSSTHTPVVMPCKNALEISSGYDLVYLDPPYVPLKRNDISYLERYHFLEGMASPENWQERIDWTRDSRCFKTTPEIKQWHTRSAFKESLFELVNKHSKSIVVLSYVMDAYPAFEEIEKYFLSVFKEVRVHSKLLSHALSKTAKTELLIVGVP
ncbi:DNA adenine methylase [Pseudomonas sp. S2_H01]